MFLLELRPVLFGKSYNVHTRNKKPMISRAGFYAENLLLYAKQAKEEGILPLPIGENHKFAPVALGVRLSDTGLGIH
jgi:hypothetical protein